MEQATQDDKRDRRLTRKVLQGAIDSKRLQLKKDAKNLEIAHSKVHPTPHGSDPNTEFLVLPAAATIKCETTLKELADLYAQDQWGDYTQEAHLTREFSALRNTREIAFGATDKKPAVYDA